MRRFYAVYASAEMMKVLPEPGRNDPVRAKSVVRSAQARGGCPAHADRVRPAACSSCMSLRSAWSLHIQIRPSSASGSAICNGARWRGSVSYFTLAAFFRSSSGAPLPRGTRRRSGSGCQRPERLSVVSSEVPWLTVSEDGVEDDDEPVHAGHEGLLAGFAGGPELGVVSGDDRIGAAGDQSRHVERSAHGGVAVRRPRSVPLSRLIGPTRPGRRSCGG